ncbi:MAG: S8 family serine peptidase [Candidatus Hermodarchaeota archaeon]
MILIKGRRMVLAAFLLVLAMSIFPPSSSLSISDKNRNLLPTDSQNLFNNNLNVQGLENIQDLLNKNINAISDPNNRIIDNPEDIDSSSNILSIRTASGESVEIPFPKNVNTIQSFSANGETSLFINDQRGGDKVEARLRDYTFLWQKGYINDGRIRVIVLPGSPLRRNVYAVAPLSYNEITFFSQQLRPFRGTIVSTFHQFPFLTLEIPYEELFELADQEFIAHVFLDKKVSVCLDQSVPIIKPPTTWAQLEAQVGFEINGSNVRIAILDTGIDTTHPDLDDLDDNPGTSDPKVLVEACFTGEGHTWDGYGHGTHCASIAAGTGEASTYTYIGVAPGAFLLNGKVLDDAGSGYDSWIIEGIEWAVNQSADIISMSFGKNINGDGTDPVSIAVDWANDQGVVCAVAAGNVGDWGMFSVGMPAVAKKAITVGSTTKVDEMSSFSSQGPASDYRLKPDVCAPGSNIVAARANGTSMGGVVDDYYTSASGTSMATPHVAGAAALMLQTHPDWTPLMIKSAFMGNGKILTGEHLWRQGAGRIDVCEATNTTLLIIEPSASFGKIENGESPNTTLVLMNLADTATSVDLSTYTLCEGNETNYVSLNTSSVTVPANGNARVLLTVGPLDENAPEGWYEGWVNVTGSQGNKTVPYLFMSMSTLSVRVFDTDNTTPIYATVALVTYPNLSLVEFGSSSTPFILRGGEYAVCAASSYIDNYSGWKNADFSRMFMLEKAVSVPKNTNINVSLSLAEAHAHSVPTVDSFGKNLTVHSYTQYFCGGPQTWYESYFQQSEWFMGDGWYGYDLNASHLTFYSTDYDPADRLCEALGYYASDSLLSEVYLVPLKYWNVSSLPDTLGYSMSDYARYSVFYDMPETYPENGLNSVNGFWFTWDHMGDSQGWGLAAYNVTAGLNATYYLAPGNGTYFGDYMPTYEGWPRRGWGPVEKWEIGHHYPYPQVPLEKGETGSMILGNFSFVPYHPSLNLSVSDLGTEFQLNLTGDLWNNLSWPHKWWRMISPLQGPESPFPQHYANYRVFVDETLYDQGQLNGQQGYNGEPFIHYPPDFLDVDWCGINETWNISGSNVRLQLTLPSLATICSHTVYNLTFSLSGSDITPPILNGIFCPTNFTPGQDLYINFTMFDVGLGIASHFLKYSFNNGTNWQDALYAAPYYTIPCEAADSLAILINVTDYAGNSLQYFSSPIALCNKVDLSVPSEIFAFTGDPVTISGNLTSLEGSGLDNLILSLTNENTFYAKVTNNGSFMFPIGALNVAGNYTYTITLASVGLYNLEEASITLRVTVDTTPPSWVEVPIDQIVEFGDNFFYDLNATDLAGISTWWLNDTAHFTIDADGIITNVASLSVGTYGLQVWVNDTHSNIQSASFTVTVQDSTLPSWVELPTDQIVEFGDNFFYDLNAADLAGISTWWLNDTAHFTIDADGIITNVASLSVGTYGLQVWVNDTHSNIQSASFTVTVQDTTPPSWGEVPTDQTLEYGDELDYQLIALDLSSIDHWIINDTIYFAISNTGHLTNATTLNPGTYGLKITVYDPYGNYNSATINITVKTMITTTPGFSAVIVLVVILLSLVLIFRRRQKLIKLPSS